MNSYIKEEQAVAAAAIKKVYVQQMFEKIARENMKVDRI